MSEYTRLDRRTFFKTCAALLAAGFLPLGCKQSDVGEVTITNTPVDASPKHSRTAFEKLPATVFSVSHDVYGVIDMDLTEVDDEAYAPEAEQFSICLTGPAVPEFTEGTYAVYNDSIGSMQLYLQPSESLPGERRYRAVFSLLHG